MNMDMRALIAIVENSIIKEQRWLPGIPGEIIARAGDDTVLVHEEDDYGDVRKQEYDVYQKDSAGTWQHKRNLNLPYSGSARAISIFKAMYGDES